MELANYPCLSVREAVHYYDVSAKQIKRDIKSGRIPAIRISTSKGKRWRIFPEGIPQHIQSTVDEHAVARNRIAELTDQVQQLEAVVEDLRNQLAAKNAVMVVEPVSVVVVDSVVPLRQKLSNLMQRLLNPVKRNEMQSAS